MDKEAVAVCAHEYWCGEACASEFMWLDPVEICPLLLLLWVIFYDLHWRLFFTSCRKTRNWEWVTWASVEPLIWEVWAILFKDWFKTRFNICLLIGPARCRLKNSQLTVHNHVFGTCSDKIWLICYQNINYCSVVLHVDGYNQASPGPGGNPGQMMVISGRRGPTGPEGTTNMGTPLMSENGSMVMYPKKRQNF